MNSIDILVVGVLYLRIKKKAGYVMKGVFFAFALLVATLYLVAPVFADGGVAAQDSDGEASAVDDQQEVECPNCGGKFAVGRHGQEGLVMKCPHCGKEVEVCKKMEEEEKGLCYGMDMAFMSKYITRGTVSTDGPVFEPNIWASYKGLTLSVWGNLDLADRHGGNITETDYAVDYSNSLGRLNYSAGLIYYAYPHTGSNDSSELYAGLGYDTILRPRLVVYYDYWQVDGYYGAFSIGHGFDLKEALKGLNASLDLSAQVGLGSKRFNNSNFGASHTAFTDLLLTSSLPVSLSDHITVKPTVCYSTVLDRTIRTKNFKNDNVVYGGVVSLSF